MALISTNVIQADDANIDAYADWRRQQYYYAEKKFTKFVYIFSVFNI